MLVRGTGAKFVAGFCGADLHVVLLESGTGGNALDAKIGFVAPAASARRHLRPIKLSNYRKQWFLALWEVKTFRQQRTGF